jgi:hypothetical protein
MKQIEANGRKITMRPPKVRDMRAVSKIEDKVERELTLISNLTGLSPDELDELDFKEYKKLQEALGGFLY